MGRKSGSYKFEKRQKELKKQKKKQEKMERRLNKDPDLEDVPPEFNPTVDGPVVEVDSEGEDPTD